MHWYCTFSRQDGHFDIIFVWLSIKTIFQKGLNICAHSETRFCSLLMSACTNTILQMLNRGPSACRTMWEEPYVFIFSANRSTPIYNTAFVLCSSTFFLVLRKERQMLFGLLVASFKYSVFLKLKYPHLHLLILCHWHIAKLFSFIT